MEELSILTPTTGAVGVYAFVEEINACLQSMPYSSIQDFTAGRANGEFMVGETHKTAEHIVEILKDEIQNNTEGAKNYAYSIDVKFFRGLARNIVEVVISILNEDRETITYNYQFK